MDRIDFAFAELSQRMSCLAVPERPLSTPQSLASLIDKVNSATRLYEQGLRRQAAFARSAIAMPATASSAPAMPSADQR